MALSRKQIILFAFFAFIGAFFGIAHGIFFDLKLSEINRLTVQGVILTSIVFFIVLFVMEHLFDLNNQEEIKRLSDEIEEIKKQIKD